MFRYFVELSYKGTHYCGWQLQPNAVTVQEILNKALSTLCNESVDTTGCGRTDTGVHALQFYAHFEVSEKITASDAFIYHINSLLPFDVAVYNIIAVKEHAHARFDALKRTYKYLITMRKDPFLQESAWFWRKRPDISLMNEAAQLLRQYTDFTCFARSGGQQATNNCTIYDARWDAEEHRLIFTISADRFLRGMVRAVVGTMMQLGTGKKTLDEFKVLLKEGTRSDAGESVPAHGLYLAEIIYPYIKTEKNIFP